MVVELRNILNEVRTIPPKEVENEKIRLLNSILNALETQNKMLAIIYEMDSIQDDLGCK